MCALETSSALWPAWQNADIENGSPGGHGGGCPTALGPVANTRSLKTRVHNYQLHNTLDRGKRGKKSWVAKGAKKHKPAPPVWVFVDNFYSGGISLTLYRQEAHKAAYIQLLEMLNRQQAHTFLVFLVLSRSTQTNMLDTDCTLRNVIVRL
jgi:hypothetical protein